MMESLILAQDERWRACLTHASRTRDGEKLAFNRIEWQTGE